MLLIETIDEPQIPGDEFEVLTRELADDVWRMLAERTERLGASDRTAVSAMAASMAHLRSMAIGMATASVSYGVPLARALPTVEELVAATRNERGVAMVAELVLTDLRGAVAAKPIA